MEIFRTFIFRPEIDSGVRGSKLGWLIFVYSIDGAALFSLTERALELLIPVIRTRVKLKLRDELKKKNDSGILVEVYNGQVNDGALIHIQSSLRRGKSLGTRLPVSARWCFPYC